MACADCGKGSNSAQCFVKKNTIKTLYIAIPVGGLYCCGEFYPLKMFIKYSS